MLAKKSYNHICLYTHRVTKTEKIIRSYTLHIHIEQGINCKQSIYTGGYYAVHAKTVFYIDTYTLHFQKTKMNITH